MYHPTVMYPHDTSAIEADARVLFGKQADKVLKQYGGSARAILEASRTRRGTAWNRLQAAHSLHARAAIETLTERNALTSPRVAKDFLVRMIGTLTHEVFSVIHLDTRHRFLSYREVFRGTVDGASVHPREIVREALQVPACAAVILAHVHPSGVREQSHADEVITTRLRDALALVDIRVVDHLIITGDQVTSLAERGLV